MTMIRSRSLSMFALVLVATGALGACRIKTEASASGPGLGGSPGGPPPGDGTGGAGYGGAAYGGAGYGGVTVEVITDDQGQEYRVQQGPKGDPAVVGCADGQREAFVDGRTFPNIAGCLASWDGKQSLRARSTAAVAACGDDAGSCPTPGDACAPGWRVCGANGKVTDLMQVTGEQCEQAGGGRFSAAISHCTAQSGCQYDKNPGATYPCFDDGWCSEPVCCGNDCGDFGACTDGVWQAQTHIPVGTDQGCNKASSARAGGILCCR
jgi:hypothetical protein